MKIRMMSILTAITVMAANLSQSGCIILLLDEPVAPRHMND